MRENGVRHRGKSNGANEVKKSGTEDRNLKDEEFITRESPLTVLTESSLHVRVIYHIFLVILLMFFCDTFIYDLVDGGKINVGLNAIIFGFGDIGRGFKLWMYEFLVTISFYPMLVGYSGLGKLSRKFPVLRHTIKQLGVIALIATLFALSIVPVYDLARKHLETGSSIAVSTELFRFMMKIIAVAKACGPRCLDGGTPLPTFQHYMYFLFAPTLLYRDQYPRTKKIRWSKVFLYVAEVVGMIFYNCFFWERFIMPYWSDYGKQSQVEAGTVVRGIFACVLPGIIAFVCGNYGILHAWLNAWAEMLKFGDRLFYEEWWTTTSYSKFYRRWNRVVHSWLRDHIYLPLSPSIGRSMSTFIVFFVSAIVHEVIISLSFGFFYPILLVEFGILGVLLVPLTATIGRRFPNAFNSFMWLGFCIGNGLMWSFYPMEHFARKNCPPSENDSFFIPKSWSCPEIVLKPGWTFQNPVSIFS